MHSLSIFLGGIGLFLLGMSLMTSGLKKLAGKRLHTWLGRATRTPTSGVLTGAAMSAVIQSSSATILAAMGFVGAGLLSFAQGLGIIVGANVGTTLTGWMVAVLGLKMSFGTVALPLLSVAAFLYLFRKRGRLDGFGKSLAGFCLLFLGLDMLQESLAGLEGQLDLNALAGPGMPVRLLALVIGVVFAMVTQSSSATVAASLSALHTGVLDLPQAIAVIIGADIGTTATAALATIGARRAAKRAGFAHVIYNLLTGIGAFLILPVYLWLAHAWLPGPAETLPEVVAVAYHSLFNTLGVLIIIPMLPRFAAFIEHLLPDEPDPWTGALDPRLAEDPHAAHDALIRSLSMICSALHRDLAARLRGSAHTSLPLGELRTALQTCRAFVLTAQSEKGSTRQIESIHILDHAERLFERLEEAESVTGLPTDLALADRLLRMADAADTCAAAYHERQEQLDEVLLETMSQAFESDQGAVRRKLVAIAVNGDLSAEALDRNLDAFRWVRRCAWHVWRTAHHWNALAPP